MTMSDNDRRSGQGADADRAANDPVPPRPSRKPEPGIPLDLLALATLWLVLVPHVGLRPMG